MGIISETVRDFTNKQKLGFVATVSADNKPNLSPKGTVSVWDEEHLVFADIKSPQTIKNLQNNPAVEINVVDPVLRKGFRFKGTAEIHHKDSIFSRAQVRFKENGIKSEIKSIVIVKVDSLTEITSPIYDLGFEEEEIRTKWKKYYLSS